MLRKILRDDDYAAIVSAAMRTRALELFDPAVVGEDWKAYLG